jgi:hypothetical protein
MAVVVGVCLGIPSVRADEQAEALKVVDAAIQAAGGAAKLDQLKTVSMKGKGTLQERGQEGTITFEGTAHGLDRFRLDLELSMMDRMNKVLVVFAGDKGWAKHDDRVEDAPEDAVPLIRAELHALRMAQMLTPLKDKDLKLSPLGEMQIGSRAAVGIKIVKKDLPALDLYFDKQTHLPVKCSLRVKEHNEEKSHEWVFSNYKEIAGVKHSMKVALNRDGEKLLELEISELKPMAKADEGTFAKP